MSNPFFIALTIMAMSLPLSRYMMSVSQFVLIGFWLYEGYENSQDNDKQKRSLPKWIWFPVQNFMGKIKHVGQNKLALAILSLYLLHLLGLFFTQHFDAALYELRTKLPILTLTLIIATSKPLSKNQFNSLLIFYIAAVISGTFFGFYKFIGQNFSDVRELSVFIHPIRFGLNICFAIFLLAYFVFQNDLKNVSSRILFTISIIWLIYFLFLLESGVGLSAMAILSFGLMFYLILKANSKFKYLYLTILCIIPVLIFLELYKISHDFYKKPNIDFKSLEAKTKLGNPYKHDTINYDVEDGKYIGLYICEKELKDAWESKSKLAFDGRDKNGQQIKKTLIRFLTSMDLRKDASGIKQLSYDQIRAIENGIANIRYLERPGIKTRWHKFLLGYENYKRNDNPNGNSLVQRLEYWKVSIRIIKENFFTGVGTGDIGATFRHFYEASNSKLNIENRRVSHNQFLYMMISFGFFGFIWFLWVLLFPLKYKVYRQDYFYLIFLGLIIISMLSDDTIRNQSGLTFFAFFNALFLFGRKSP